MMRLAVFDLDYTVWKPEMYQLYGGPRLTTPSNRVSDKALEEARTTEHPKILVDSSGTPIRVFAGAAHALAEINRLRDQEGHDIRAAVASRTDEPHWAEICMDYLVASDGSSLSDCFGDLVEISFSNKKEHFRRLHKKTGIPYDQMAFFDNEHYNITSVQQLGVMCFYTPDGMMKEHWEEAKRKFGMS